MNNNDLTYPQEDVIEYLSVDIIEYSNDHFPGHVTCKFIDIYGKIHHIYEKAPVVASKLDENSILPQKGYIAGEIIFNKKGIIKFSTKKPWDIETKENQNVFYVHENQIINELADKKE